MPITGSSPNKSFTREVATFTGSDAFQQLDTSGRKILSVDQDEAGNDYAAGINAALFKNGDNFSADIPTSGQKFTGVGNATARNHFAAAGQVQDNSFAYAATSGNDTITATLSPAITAYAAGQLWCMKIGGTNTGAASLNVNSVGADDIKKGIDGSLDIEAGDLPAGRMAIFAHDGTNVQLLNPPEFPSGTKMLFWQTTPPTGWTKDTSNNDKALRVTSGTVSTGGSVAFETAFASKAVAGTVGDTTLTIDQIPAHTHTGGWVLQGSTDDVGGGDDRGVAANTGSTGGGESHTHTFTGTAIDLDVSYVDVVLATKD